jgi:hypothetical protein
MNKSVAKDLGQNATSTDSITVTARSLADLAVINWRLHCWAFSSGFESERGIARQASRTFSSFLEKVGVETCDLTGQAFDPGLAIEVIDSEQDPDAGEDTATIGETITPIVFWRGRVIRHGQVVIHRGTAKPETSL